MENLTDQDRGILESLGHTVEPEGMPLPRREIPKETERKAKVDVAPPNFEPIAPEKTPSPKVLERLKANFGLGKLKTATTVLSGMEFTLKSISASMLGWAESLALDEVIRPDGQYLISEFQAKRTLYLAGCYVDKIDGEPLTEIFKGRTERDSRTQFIEFLKDDPTGLASHLFDVYDTKVEKFVKLTTQVADNTSMYICPTCKDIKIYPKDKTYYCHKDKTLMNTFESGDFPLV